MTKYDKVIGIIDTQKSDEMGSEITNMVVKMANDMDIEFPVETTREIQVFLLTKLPDEDIDFLYQYSTENPELVKKFYDITHRTMLLGIEHQDVINNTTQTALEEMGIV